MKIPFFRRLVGTAKAQSPDERNLLKKDIKKDSDDMSRLGEFQLGGRQEAFNGFFDDMSQFIAHFETIRRELEEKQRQLNGEFEDRARERNELNATAKALEASRNQNVEQGKQIAALADRVVKLELDLEAKNTVTDRLRDQFSESEILVDEQRITIVKLKSELENRQEFADRVLETLQTAQRERDGFAKQSAEADERIRSLEISLQEKGHALRSVESERDALRKFSDEARQQTAMLLGRISQLEHDHAQQASLVAALEEQVRALQATGAQLALEYEEFQAAAQAEAAQAAIRVDSATSKLRRLEHENLVLLQQAQEVNGELRALRRRHVDADVERQRLSERLEGFQIENEMLRREHGAAETARSAAVDRADQLSSALDRRRVEIERIQTRCATLEHRMKELQHSGEIAAKSAADRETNLKDMVDRLRAENVVLSGALDELRKERQRLSNEINRGWKSQLDSDSLISDGSDVSWRKDQLPSDRTLNIIS